MEAYDKAKWHDETCEKEGLSEEHAFMHTAVFICWLAENDMLDLESFGGDDGEGDKIRSRQGSPIDLYEGLDGCFFPEMLTEDGRKFSDAYFDFDRGTYIEDYNVFLVGKLRTQYHVPVTWESYETMVPVINARYRAFLGEELVLPPPPGRASKPWWKFWA